MRTPRTAPLTLAILTVLACLAPDAGAQQRRRAPGGAPPLSMPEPSAAMKRRYPFAGAWQGTQTLPEGRDTRPMAMTFSVADSSAGTYDGTQLMADGGSVPYPGAKAKGGVLSWTSPNSGGGSWVFTARIAADTLVGQAVLKDAPWKPSPEPVMTFRLVRPTTGSH